ncbi:hypothetical protein ACFYVR_26275 [Rhodococcus sp. NPDC003318]|uniref:hypothetical protein n=1 Tax=Rhodococcus sp. NPDC003318 TaxID=3364503 RepID=UPI0036742634
MSGHVPLTVRARLAGGVAHSAPWGISLDGLLASQIRAGVKAAARDAGTDYPPYDPAQPPDELELPLTRCTAAGGDNWHWAATFAHAEGEVAGPHVTYWTARPDQYALDHLSDRLPAHVSERQGRYRSRVMPLPLTIARALVWRAVGDPDVIRDLLAGVMVIGRKRSSGHGHVFDWTVTPDPGADPWECAHLHPDGTLGRSTPPGCLADRRDIATGGSGHFGLRPPYMHPAMRRRVVFAAR